MNPSIERIDDTAIDRYNRFGELFDKIVLLAGAVALVEEHDPSEISDNFGSQFDHLFDNIPNFQRVKVTYSGKGFTPVIGPGGDPISVYKQIDRHTGKFHSVFLAHKERIKHTTQDEIVVFEEPGVYSQLLEDADNNEQNRLMTLKNSIENAPEGIRLYIRFVLREETEADLQMHGICVHTENYIVSDVIDAAELQVEHFEFEDSSSVLHPSEVIGNIEEYSKRYRRLLISKQFRNLHPEKQQTILESQLIQLNNKARMDRFWMFGSKNYAYVPNTRGEQGSFERIYIKESYKGRCVRLDCTELNTVLQGVPVRKRKGNVDTNGSLCIVAELSDEEREQIGIESNIIWIPVNGQLDELSFIEEYKLYQ